MIFLGAAAAAVAAIKLRKRREYLGKLIIASVNFFAFCSYATPQVKKGYFYFFLDWALSLIRHFALLLIPTFNLRLYHVASQVIILVPTFSVSVGCFSSFVERYLLTALSNLIRNEA